MSNRPSAPQPSPSTDRPTATYPTGYPMPEGWQADPRPSRYLDPADPRLQAADATPTGMFPTRRSIRPLGQAAHAAHAAHAARPEQATDAATTARTRPRTRPGTHACHTPAQPSTGHEQASPVPAPLEQETPIQDMGRPGILARPAMAWHPSLMQLAIGAALVVALLTSSQLLALDGIYSARQAALRESRHAASASAPQQVPASASPSSKAVWTVHGTDAPYDRTDPTASPLDLPRCTTSPDTPMPCLAHISADSHHATVLEEDASLTGLDRR